MAKMKHVLLVEEDSLVRNFLATAFARESCQVTPVSDARKAIALMEDGAAFDLVVVDLAARRGGGLTVLAAMRVWLPRARGILVSRAGYDEQTLAKARELADRVMVKPIGLDDVWNVLTQP